MKPFGCRYSSISSGTCLTTNDNTVDRRCFKTRQGCHVGMIYISGPVGIDIAKYNNKTFYLVSDRHGSIDNGC